MQVALDRKAPALEVEAPLAQHLRQQVVGGQQLARQLPAVLRVDEEVLEQLVGQVLDLIGLVVRGAQVPVALRVVAVLAVRHDVEIAEQRGQRGAQVVAHRGDQLLICPARLLLGRLPLDDRAAHIVHAAREVAELVPPAHRDRIAQVAALENADLALELGDVGQLGADDPGQHEEEDQKGEEKGQGDRGVVIPVLIVGVEIDIGFAVGESHGRERIPAVVHGHRRRGILIGVGIGGIVFVIGVIDRVIGLGRQHRVVDQRVAPVDRQVDLPLLPAPLVERGQVVQRDVVLVDELLQPGHAPLLRPGLIVAAVKNLVHDRERAFDRGQEHERGHAEGQEHREDQLHLQPVAKALFNQADTPCPRRF